MASKVVMPQVGLTTTEGVIVEWYKKEGERVAKGDKLFCIETDKVTMDIESTASGVLRKIMVPAGTPAQVTQTVAIIGEPEEDISQLLEGEEKEKDKPTEGPKLAERGAQKYDLPGETEPYPTRLKISPLAKRMAKEKGISFKALADLKGTGPGGSIVKRDVLAYLDSLKERQPSQSLERALDKAGTPTPPTAETVSTFSSPKGRIVPLTNMRRIIAQRMSQSSHDIPQFWLKVEAKAEALIRWREILNEKMKGENGETKLTFTDFLVKASALALRECPYVNSRYTQEGIVYLDEINVGIAIALAEGLVVPVIKDAARKTLLEIAKERTDLVRKAREGNLSLEELSGGTFTVSNLGMYDVDEFVALINPPEAAILAVGRLREKLELVNGEVRAVPFFSLTLTFDHRIVDGAQGARFLQKIKERVEDPHLLLL